jgi:hypothetical protein
MEEENNFNESNTDYNTMSEKMKLLYEMIIPFDEVDYTPYFKRFIFYILFSMWVFFLIVFFSIKNIITLKIKHMKPLFKGIKKIDSEFKNHFNI